MAGERQTEPHRREGQFAFERRMHGPPDRTDDVVAEIVALVRSYANVHMTKALADLIEHKYGRDAPET